MTIFVGYARVSTEDQHLHLQLDALKNAGVEDDLLFTDKASSVSALRPGLDQLKKVLRKGDTLVVWRLDRLGRSVRELTALLEQLDKKEIGFRSLTEGMDTNTVGGRLIFHIFAAVAEMERRLIQERTIAGLAAARARGRMGGRKKTITPEKLEAAKALLAGGLTVPQAAKQLQVGPSTLYRDIRADRRAEEALLAAAAAE
jgi:DNA invertase Pin-like site-specific DNA recombinase